MSDNKKTGSMLGGKGYYIALILCAAAIGISGYVYYRNLNQSTDVLATVGNDLSVAATQPGTTDPGNTQEPTEKPTLKTAAPVAGETVAEFAVDCLGYNETTRDWRTHHGVDIAAEAGTTVLAASAGTVLAVRNDDMMGTTVVIDHGDGCQTTYANLQARPTVVAGDEVSAGQIIGAVGTTAAAESAHGPHLHFSVSKNGDAIDPNTYLKK